MKTTTIRPRKRYEGNIKFDLPETDCEDRRWMGLTVSIVCHDGTKF